MKLIGFIIQHYKKNKLMEKKNNSYSKSHLFPTKIYVILGFPFPLTSSSHLFKFSNVSRL